MSSTSTPSDDSAKVTSPSSLNVKEDKKSDAGPPIPTMGVLPSIASNLTPVAGLAAWIVNPLRAVGPTAVDLGSMPSGRDYASRSACKSQAYTSWESLSRSFVGSLVYRGVEEEEEGQQQPAPPSSRPTRARRTKRARASAVYKGSEGPTPSRKEKILPRSRSPNRHTSRKLNIPRANKATLCP